MKAKKNLELLSQKIAERQRIIDSSDSTVEQKNRAMKEIESTIFGAQLSMFEIIKLDEMILKNLEKNN